MRPANLASSGASNEASDDPWFPSAEAPSMSESSGGVSGGESVDQFSASNPPPRSRTGCRTCRQRKVKCDERRPICNNCRNLNRQCDYTVHFQWHEGLNMDKHNSITRKGCPVWDGTTPATSSVTLMNPASLPPITQVATDEDREYIAAHAHPAQYFYVYTPPLFDRLPEYQRWQGKGNRQTSAHARWPLLPPAVNSDGMYIFEHGPQTIVAERLDEPRLSNNAQQPVAAMAPAGLPSPTRAAFATKIEALSISGPGPETQQHDYRPGTFAMPAYAPGFHTAGVSAGCTVAYPGPGYPQAGSPVVQQGYGFGGAPAFLPTSQNMMYPPPSSAPAVGIRPRSNSVLEMMIGSGELAHADGESDGDYE